MLHNLQLMSTAQSKWYYLSVCIVQPSTQAWVNLFAAPTYVFTMHAFVGFSIAFLFHGLIVFTPRAHVQAGLSNWFCPSVSVSVSHQNFGLITTTKGLNISKRHPNNDNSKKNSACMVYLKVAEAVLFARISSYLWP